MTDIQALKGIGPRRAELFQRLGITTVEDLLEDLPRAYEDRGKLVALEDLVDGSYQTVRVELQTLSRLAWLPGKRSLQRAVFRDATGELVVKWHNQPYLSRNLRPGDSFYLYGRYLAEKNEMNDPQMGRITKENEETLQKKFLSIQPVYRLTEGLSNTLRQRAVASAFAAGYEIQDWLPDLLVQTLSSWTETLRILHSPASPEELQKGERAWQIRQALDQVLIREEIQKARKDKCSLTMQAVDMAPFFQQLPFQLTSSQEQVLQQILEDLLKPLPMNRLLQGDVGSGKTAVALAASYFVLANGYQVAFMAPTEILASQHAEKSRKLFQPFDFPVYLLTGSADEQMRRRVEEAAESGRPALFLGTHALFADRLHFSNLALTITDEQHRFGVRQRAQLQGKAMEPNSLVLSATPIPRTLALVRYGDLDLSQIHGKPVGRQSIESFAVDARYERRVYRFLGKRAQAGEQSYIVCPRIEEAGGDLDAWSVERVSQRLKTFLSREFDADVHFFSTSSESAKTSPAFSASRKKRDCHGQSLENPGTLNPERQKPDLVIGILTGPMPAEEKAKVMEAFRQGQIQILISTSVIEVGIDVENATSILVLAADQFGLAQLHQLRGRVGRGWKKSYCILMSRLPSSLNRLKILEETEDGMEIAKKDLAMRGAGDRYGTLQHGLTDTSLLPASSEDLREACALLEACYGEIPDEKRLPPAWQARLERQKETLFSFQLN